ncbi:MULTISPECIES: SDR family NAD(P)-dependent oxidoreductase [unclassified Arenibacter]|uniref:SDR family NAD(P)-dependent oxidoreductase n=1 Tax=unclassified Arenibacter TaxID=2615047 RepID=UPI000E350105|nr:MULTISPECIES: SDR family NAD(P)-dependent oxidoreductase [unclassified Arenibacter]MCM4164690.1 short-chain dehydrogenase [Arenibacter sp. A80]RFT55765.1 SDR family NAD(P)-dependent oxidoreductase [Arenibacter sp. P308M17]
MKVKRIAVVTESGNGLGKVFANILWNNNYEVILAASKKSYELLSRDGGVLHDYKLVKTDFTSAESLLELKTKIETEFGRLDLLVNNAEIANGFGQKIDQIDIDEVRQLYETNLFAVIRIIQIVKPLLEKGMDPRIINMTSAMGDINKMKDDRFCYSNYCMTAYATSKAALNMFTHLQCKEFKPSKIKINSFDPIALKNCTHNSVTICDGIKDDFIALIQHEASSIG